MARLREIAARAGVSVTTVSRILNYDEKLNVQDQTRKRVFEAADALEYRKTPKKKRKPRLRIGVLCSCSAEEELEDTYYLSLRLAAEKEIAEEGHKKIPLSRETFSEKAEDTDGLICIGTFVQPEIERISELKKPAVFVDASGDRTASDSIVVDFALSVQQALNHLTGLGHRRIAFIGGVDRDADGRRIEDLRETIFRSYMRQRGFLREEYVRLEHYTPKSGYRLAKELLAASETKRPTALLAANDSIAVGVYRAAQELGLRIPQDISVIGFNDISISKYLAPPLTTVHVYQEFMGMRAVQLLADRITTGRDISMHVAVSTKLVIRESTAAPDGTEAERSSAPCGTSDHAAETAAGTSRRAN